MGGNEPSGIVITQCKFKCKCVLWCGVAWGGSLWVKGLGGINIGSVKAVDSLGAKELGAEKSVAGSA